MPRPLAVFSGGCAVGCEVDGRAAADCNPVTREYAGFHLESDVKWCHYLRGIFFGISRGGGVMRER